MQIALGMIGLLLIVSALIGVVRQPLTMNRRFWIVVQFLAAAVIFWISPRVQQQFRDETSPYQMDRSSVIAKFASISVDGPQRQLVFHYVLENTTSQPFLINQSACSFVSFRFLEKKNAEPKPGPPPNPALNLLEKDKSAYAKFAGLERIATSTSALALDECPLELQSKERRAVAIAIPYAYPGAARQNPSAEELKIYVGAFMPRIDGFGLSDLERRYEIDFPRGW
jgi:hypothetical protein